MTSELEIKLIRDIRQGGAAASRAWYDFVIMYEGRLQAYVRKRIKDSQLVEDVVQETFDAFSKSLGNYDETRSLQNWLFTIASFKLTDCLRRIHRKRVDSLAQAEDSLDYEADPRQARPSSVARQQELLDLEAAAIQKALVELITEYKKPKKYKQLLTLELLFLRGIPNKEVARILNLSEQDVANYRHAAVSKIKKNLREQGLSADVFPELQEPGPATSDAAEPTGKSDRPPS